jgi:uncharacterized protein YbjT (DUF2867 family)
MITTVRIHHDPGMGFRAAEALLRSSDVDWTVIRPSRLTDRPTRRYRARRGAGLWFGFTIAVAH